MDKKYYYIKLKENFFNSDELVFLESMPDGYLYSNILLKMYLRSLRQQGKLMVKDSIPYNSEMLSAATGHPVAVVEKGLAIFRELGLIEILDNGAIYMMDIQNYIGQSSSEADRVRQYRSRIAAEKEPTRIQAIEQPETTDNRPRIDYKKIVDDYNRTCTRLAGCKKISETRKKAIAARLNTYSEEELHEVFELAQESDFLCGKNDRNWKADFDWLMKDRNAAKVLEGKYNNSGTVAKTENMYGEMI